MDDSQAQKINLLSRCVFQVGSYDKRFVRNLAGLSTDVELTPKQAHLLEQIFHRYRRQIRNHKTICKVCSGEVEEAKRQRIEKPDLDKVKLERWIKSTE
jgi:hypothetical protein